MYQGEAEASCSFDSLLLSNELSGPEQTTLVLLLGSFQVLRLTKA